MYYSEEGLNLLLAITRIAFFYRDVVFDVLLICVLYHIDENILGRLIGQGSDGYYDSVGGLNLLFTCYYLMFVLISSETWIYIQVLRKRMGFAKIFAVENYEKMSTTTAIVFPIHFCKMEEFEIEFKIRSIEREITKELNKINEEGYNDFSAYVIEKAAVLQNLHKQLYELNDLYCQIQVVESVGEREFQIVLQTLLYVQAQYYLRLGTLFNEQFGIPITVLFVASWTIGILSVSNSIIKYRNSHRFPFGPGILGKILIFLTVMILVIGKTVFVSAALLNMPYLHPLVHIIKILITYLYNRFLWRKTDSHCIESVLAASVVAAFIRVPKSNSETRNFTLRKFLIMSSGIPSVLILELISYVLYDVVGNIARQFTTLQEIDEDGLGDNAKKWMYYYKIVFRQLDITFAISWFAVVILLYLIFVMLYYYRGHPKKDIINEKKKDKPTKSSKKDSDNLLDSQSKKEGVSFPCPKKPVPEETRNTIEETTVNMVSNPDANSNEETNLDIAKTGCGSQQHFTESGEEVISVVVHTDDTSMEKVTFSILKEVEI